MMRTILLAALLMTAVVVALPQAAAIQDLETICQNLGPCTPAYPGCWIENVVPPSIQCRL